MRKSQLLHLFGIILAASLTACATEGVKPTNPLVVARLQAVDHAHKATVVIYRPGAALGAALRPTVVLNGKDFVNIGNGKVFVGSINPGHYIFEMDDKRSGTEVDLKPGGEVYMKIEIVPGFWKGGGKLTQVAPEQGRYESSRLDLIESKEIEDPSFR